MTDKHTNDVAKIVRDKLTNEGVFLVRYKNIQDFVAKRLIEYIAKHFNYKFDINTYSNKLMERWLNEIDRQIKAYGIDLSTPIDDPDKAPMTYAVDFIFNISQELVNPEYVQLEIKEISDEAITFKAVILLDKRKEYERFPRLMTEEFPEYTGKGPFDQDYEVLFEHRKKFIQLRTFSEVLDYAYGIIDEMQNQYKEQCIQHLRLKR